MPESSRSNNLPATNREYRETSIISIDSDGENQDTNQDAPYELDSEYPVPLEYALGPVADYVNKDKGKQRAQDDEIAEDGDNEDDYEYSEDEDDEMFDRDYVFEGNEGEVEDTGPSQEEVAEWARIQLEKIDKDIEAAKKRINDLDEKKRKAEGRAVDNKTRLRLEHAAKKLGAHALQKIQKQQTGAEHSVAKTSTELQKVQERLANLEAQREDIEEHTLFKYHEALQKHRPKKSRNMDNRHFPPEHNLDSANDSLSEPMREQDRKAREKARKRREAREGKKTKKAKKTRKTTDADEPDETDDDNKKAHACQRCRLAKQKCTYIPGNSSCNRCAITGERCRYRDYFTGHQIRPNYLQDKLAELAAVKAELAKFQQKSAFSVGAENPLSGITGYGPPTQKWARQNWALMVRGLSPRPLPASTQDEHSDSVPVKRKSPTNPIEGEPSQPAKRQRQTEPQSNPSSKQYSFQNATSESFAGPSKRGRKPGQTSSTRTTRQTTRQQQQQAEEQNRQNEPPSFEFTFECPAPVPTDDSTNPTYPPTENQPLINATSVKNTKLWWAQMISDRGGKLPVNVLFTPGWPRWADYMNEKQELWFNALYSAGIQIPLVEGKSIDDDGGVEPLWPSWTRVPEVLDEDQIEHLTLCVEGGYEIRELHGQGGVGQGTVDWVFAETPAE